jgi:hypothetical protein
MAGRLHGSIFNCDTVLNPRNSPPRFLIVATRPTNEQTSLTRKKASKKRSEEPKIEAKEIKQQTPRSTKHQPTSLELESDRPLYRVHTLETRQRLSTSNEPSTTWQIIAKVLHFTQHKHLQHVTTLHLTTLRQPLAPIPPPLPCRRNRN